MSVLAACVASTNFCVAQQTVVPPQSTIDDTPVSTPLQQPPNLPQNPAPQPQSLTAGNIQPCVQPAPMVRLEDYQGPFRKVIGTFAGRVDRATATVHPSPHYKAGAILCTLLVKDKFKLFLADSIDPGTFLSAAFDAGIDQAQNAQPSFGQGMLGYTKRFSANLAGQATSRFFMDFAYPTIFSEDPRYYRMTSGTFKRRLLNAVEHSVVAYHDNGHAMFNFNEWLGTLSSGLVSNTYLPDNRRGVVPMTRRVVYAVSQDVGFDVLREFWPEISRKLKLPFRGEPSLVVKPVPAPVPSPTEF